MKHSPLILLVKLLGQGLIGLCASGPVVVGQHGSAVAGRLGQAYIAGNDAGVDLAEEVKRYFPGKVYASVIPRNVRLSEAPSHGKPVLAYDKWSRGAEAYEALAEEFHNKNKA